MAFTTQDTIVTGALLLLGVIDPEDTPSNPMMADGRRRLNNMMGQWSLQELTIPTIERDVFAIVAGKGSPANPYSVGSGGDLGMVRPVRMAGCGLQLNASLPTPVEIPRGMLTDASYQALQIKDLTNALFTNAYYNPTFASGLGQLFLWPVPDGSQPTSLVLYHAQQLGLFTSPTAQYDLPEGTDEAIEYNLALRLSDVYKVDSATLTTIASIARTSLAIYKRSNTPLVDLPVDAMFARDRRDGYNINTGE